MKKNWIPAFAGMTALGCGSDGADTTDRKML